MSAQTSRRTSPRRGRRGQRGAPRRARVPGARGAGAAERRRAVDVPGGGRPAAEARSGGSRWTRSSARSGAARARRSVAAWSAGRRRRGDRRRCGGGSSGPAARRLAGRGRDELRDGSFVAQRADEHADAGLGLEGRGLLREQPVGRRDPQHLVEVGGRHQDRDARAPGDRARAPPRPSGGSRSGRWRRREPASTSSCSTSTAGRLSATRRAASVAQSCPSVATRVVGARAATASSGSRSQRGAGAAAAARGR